MFTFFFALAIWFLLKQYLSTITKTCCSALMPFFVISIISIRRYCTWYFLYRVFCEFQWKKFCLFIIHRRKNIWDVKYYQKKIRKWIYYLWPQAQNQTLNKTTTYHNTHRIHILTNVVLLCRIFNYFTKHSYLCAKCGCLVVLPSFNGVLNQNLYLLFEHISWKIEQRNCQRFKNWSVLTYA